MNKLTVFIDALFLGILDTHILTVWKKTIKTSSVHSIAFLSDMALK